MMTVAVTGASGLLGGNLICLLVTRGFKVRALRRSRESTAHLPNLNVTWHDSDVADRTSLECMFSETEAVFNCAGSVVQSSHFRPEHIEANIQLTQRVIEAARNTGVKRLIHSSSTITCAISEDGSEVDEKRPWNLPDLGFSDGYALSKRAAEVMMLEASRSGMEVVIVNPGFMFGPLDAKPSSGQLIVDVGTRRALAWPAGCNNFVDVRDVAAGMIAALAAGRSGERYILGGQNLSYREVIVLIASSIGRQPPRFGLPHGLARVAGWFGDAQEFITARPTAINTATVRYGYCDGLRYSSAKAKRELGYAPRPVRDAIVDAITWFRSAGLMN